jgi:hypothetical protein
MRSHLTKPIHNSATPLRDLEEVLPEPNSKREVAKAHAA